MKLIIIATLISILSLNNAYAKTNLEKECKIQYGHATAPAKQGSMDYPGYSGKNKRIKEKDESKPDKTGIKRCINM